MWKKSNIKKLEKKTSLTLHIFLLTTFLLFAVCGITYTFIAWATPATWLSIAVQDINDNTLELLKQLEQSQRTKANEIIQEFLQKNAVGITITNEEGLIQSYQYEVKDAIFQTDIAVVTSAESEVPFHISSELELSTGTPFPFRFSSEDTVYFLTVHPKFTTTINQTEKALLKVLPTLAIFILFLSFTVAFFYSYYITRPILRLSKVSEKMAVLDFSLTCNENRKDEIGILSQNLNRLSEHLTSALSNLKKANQALQKDMEKERQLKKQQTTFFSAASHELKTPITILKGQLSGMLAGIDIYQNRDKYLARSLAVTNRMDALVKELLTISRIETIDSLVTSSTCSLFWLVEQALCQIQELIELHQHTLKIDIDSNFLLQGDVTLLKRAITNLLSNAALYSPPHSQIQIILQQKEKGASLQIENSNVTIPEEALPNLFHAFYRVEASRNRNTGGSGLGLYLVKRIFDLHGYTYHIFNHQNSVVTCIHFYK